MRIDNMPGCCTSAVIHALGEHGEDSKVTVENIFDLVASKLIEVHDPITQTVTEQAKHCIFALSVDPVNIEIFKAAGFKVIDTYKGVQGLVHIMTLHD